MRKILKSIHSRISRIIPCILAVLTSLTLPFSAAFAAPAVVPVTAEAIIELLIALGVITGSAEAGYYISENCDPYTVTIFEQQLGIVTKEGIPIATEDLEKAYGTFIPTDIYFTDGNKFYIGNKEVESDDLFTYALNIAGTSFGFPVNVVDIAPYYKMSSGANTGFFSPLETKQVEKGYCYIPMYDYQQRPFWNSFALQLSTMKLYSYDGRELTDYGDYNPEISYISTGSSGLVPFVLGTNTPTINGNYRLSTNSYGGNTAYNSQGFPGTLNNIYPTARYITFAITDGVPTNVVEGDKTKLDGAVVQIKTEKDDDNNGSTPPVPQPPDSWEIWQTISQLLDEIDTGTDTNGNNTYHDYVNNNYNYVNVDINVPDKIDQNINISGNVTIHEDVSLPTGGDGSGFYNPDAVDAIAALTTNNPAVQVIKGLFEAIDPALVGIFSVSVSLLVALGIWKLIRG